MQIRTGFLLGGAAGIAFVVAGPLATVSVAAQGNLPQVNATPLDVGTCKAPTSYQGTNKVLTCGCPAKAGDPNASGSVWGTDVYTGDSYICKAARHAGVISNSGGQVVLQMLPGQASYVGSTRNGEQTRSYGRYRASYRFVTTGAPEQAADDEAPAARLVTDLPDFDKSMVYSPTKKQSKVGNVLGEVARRADSETVRDIAGAGAELANLPGSGAGAEDIGQCTGVRPKYRVKPGKMLSCTCKANFSVKSPIWGTGVYSGDSYICKSALHAGAIGREGGRVAFQTMGDQTSYSGSVRNGIRSMSYGPTNRLGSYRFVE